MVPLVPTYIWPTDDEAYKRAISGYMPGLAIVTGDNSGPGNSQSEDLAVRIQWLVDRSWQAVGYVRLDYMKRPILDIAADVVRWRSWYPDVAGFFFDECPNMKAGALEAASALEALAMQHGSFCVFNPGAPVDNEWFDVLLRSTIVTFEGTAETYAHVNAQRHPRAAHLVYAATRPVGITAGYGSTTTDGEATDSPANPFDADGVAAPGVAWNADRVFDIRDTTPADAYHG